MPAPNPIPISGKNGPPDNFAVLDFRASWGIERRLVGRLVTFKGSVMQDRGGRRAFVKQLAFAVDGLLILAVYAGAIFS